MLNGSEQLVSRSGSFASKQKISVNPSALWASEARGVEKTCALARIKLILSYYYAVTSVTILSDLFAALVCLILMYPIIKYIFVN
jgi:hypothetical protein